MGHIEATRELSAGPEALWGTVSDLANWDKWFTVHEKWLEDPPDTLTEGTKLTAKIVMLGMANKIEWTIELGRRAALAGALGHRYGRRQGPVHLHHRPGRQGFEVHGIR